MWALPETAMDMLCNCLVDAYGWGGGWAQTFLTDGPLKWELKQPMPLESDLARTFPPLFFLPISYVHPISPAPSLSGNSDPTSHSRHFPPPTMAHAFVFIARRVQHFLFSSTRVESCLTIPWGIERCVKLEHLQVARGSTYGWNCSSG